MTLKVKYDRWYLVTEKGREVKTMFSRFAPVETVKKFFRERYGLELRETT